MGDFLNQLHEIPLPISNSFKMINITQDSEFMTNLLPANPVPAGKRFAILQDQDTNPAVFSLGEDAVLNLIITQNGAPALIDFGNLCKFSGKILAFDVQQNSDTSLSIVVATDAGQNHCNVYVLVNMMPRQLLSPQPSDILFAGASYPVIFDLFLSNFTVLVGSANFPMIFLSLAPPGAITKSSQLGYLDISAQANGGFSFSLDTSWRLSTDPVEILGVTWGTCPVGQGAFVLYTASDGNHIQFRTFKGNDFTSEMQCPSGALCIDTFVDPATGNTVLLVGGDVITQFDFHQYTSGSGSGTPVATGDSALGLKDIHVSLSQDLITIWYTTLANGVHYYSAPITALNSGQLIQLLDDGAGGRISTMLVAKEAKGALFVNTLISADQTGSLTLLQCGSDTGIWQPIPFFVPSASNNMEVPSFTLRFKATSDDPNQPVENCQLHITSSGSVEAFSNGFSATLDQEGRWYQADSFGVVSVIVSTSDMASFTFQVDQFQAQGQSATTVTSAVLNPNGKLNTNLMAIKTGDDLLNAKTQTGEPLIAAGTVNQDDANHAADLIKQMNSMSMVMGQPSHQLKKWKDYPAVDIPSHVTPIILGGRLPQDPAELAAFMARLSKHDWRTGWGFFPWVYRKAKQATNWVLQKAGDVVSLVVEIGGAIYNFVLQGVEAIGKAMSWVFEKITVGIQRLIDFLGFIFSWQDMLTTSDSIVAVINAALDYGQDQIPGLKAQEQAWVRSLRDSVQNRIAPVAAATGTETKDPEESASMDATKDGVAYNWTSYQVTYGGLASNSAITPPTESSATSVADDATLQDLWNQISNIFATVEHLVSDIGQDVRDLFTTSTTSSDIYARLQEQLINSALDTVQNVADALLTALSLALSKFRDLGNQSIQIPIFSSLWKKITNGRDFTVFNAFALLLAIPSTIVYKLVRKKAPPSLKDMNKNDFSAYVNGTSRLQEGVEGFSPSDIGKVLNVMNLARLRIQADLQTVKAFATKNTPSGETIDTGLIFLGIATAAHGWPVAGSNDMALRWTVWFLDCSNTLTLAISRIVGWKTGTPSAVTAPLTETWAVITSIPTFLLQILIVTHGESGTTLTRHIVENTFGMLKVWLSAIATVSPDGKIKTIATLGKYTCLFISSVMKFSDWYNSEAVLVGGVLVMVHMQDESERAEEVDSGFVKALPPAQESETEKMAKE